MQYIYLSFIINIASLFSSGTEILFSHVIVQMIVMMIQTITVLLIGFVLFGLTIKGSVGWVIMLTAITGLCGMTFGKYLHTNSLQTLYWTILQKVKSQSKKCFISMNTIYVHLQHFWIWISIWSVDHPILGERQKNNAFQIFIQIYICLRTII